MKRVLLLATLAVTCVFSACKKDEDKPKSKGDLLMAKSWRMTAQTEAVGAAAATDTFSGDEDCSKDDLLKFMQNGVALLDEGPTKCDPNDPQSFPANWALSDNDSKLTLTIFIGAVTYDVEQLTSDKMILVERDTDNGVTTVTRSTFTGQ